MRTVFYTPDSMKSIAAARDELLAHMKRALEGAVDSPVSTAVDLQSLKQGSPTERQLAEVARALEGLTLEHQEMRRAIIQQTARRSLPAEVRLNLERAHDQLQAQLGDEPPPFDLEQVADLVASVRQHITPRRPNTEALMRAVALLAASATGVEPLTTALIAAALAGRPDTDLSDEAAIRELLRQHQPLEKQQEEAQGDDTKPSEE